MTSLIARTLGSFFNNFTLYLSLYIRKKSFSFKRGALSYKKIYTFASELTILLLRTSIDKNRQALNIIFDNSKTMQVLFGLLICWLGKLYIRYTNCTALGTIVSRGQRDKIHNMYFHGIKFVAIIFVIFYRYAEL